MTVQYLGGDNYLVHIGIRTFELNTQEIDLIQRYDFIENEFTSSVQDFKNEIWDLEYKIDSLEQELEDRDNAD